MNSPLTILLLAVTSLGMSCGETPHMQRLAASYITAANNGDYIAAAHLFHYPATERGAVLAHDIDQVARELQSLAEYFGKIVSIGPATSAIMVDVGVGSGDLAYWQQHPPVATLSYVVRFTKYGEGRLVLFLSKSGTHWQLREVRYGLPLRDPHTVFRVKVVAAALAQDLSQ